MGETKVLIFGKQNCGECKKAKSRVGNCVSKWGLDSEISVIFMDMDTLEGLSEGAYRDVWEVPTTIVEQSSTTVARWDGKAPKSDSLRATLVA